MKNLFLTLALVCCVSFAFANEGDKKENPKMKETVEKQVAPEESVNFRIECFGLSCATVCLDIRGEVSGDGYANLWEFMNSFYCK